MRWFVLLLAAIIACAPVAGASETPAPTATPIQAADPLTKESCITVLQNYYTAEQWEGLRERIGIHPIGPHFGEQACEDEMYYQRVPLEVRLIMYNIETRKLKREVSSLHLGIASLQSCIMQLRSGLSSVGCR